MPPRQSRSSLPTPSNSKVTKAARSKTRKRTLDAYSIASHSTNEKPSFRRSRLGEVLDDGPSQKRRKVGDDEDEDEEDLSDGPPRKRPSNDDGGSDSEGNEWRLGGLRSDDEDSELDSDDAFGNSDEEKFEGFTFRGSSTSKGGMKKKHKIAKRGDEVDLAEDVDEEDEVDEDGFGDEGVDLATMLDNDGEDKDEGTEDSEDEDEEKYESSEDDMDDNEGMARIRDRLDTMDATDSRAAAEAQPSALTVDDLLATLDPSARKQYDAALKTRKKSSRPTTLSAPLPKRQQDRLNREVATDKAKEQLDRWRDTVIQNRRAEFLSFPLKYSDEVAPVGKEKFIVDDKPRNELEENIQRIMEESGLTATSGKADAEDEGAALLKAEELATNHLPVEDVLRRRAELRRARELLFREEIKARRIAKIKSRSFRRVHRKERRKQKELEKGLMGSEDEEDEQEAAERKRAIARMSTKHRDSKFAKALRETGRGTWDEGARDAVIDEARRREELGRRIRGADVGDDDSDGSSGDNDDGGEGGFEGFGSDDGADLRRLNRLREKEAQEGEVAGLAGMKFMRAAEERQKAQNAEDVERLRKELAVQDGVELDSGDESDAGSQGLGRAIFGPKTTAGKKATTKRAELEEGEHSGSEEDAVVIQTRASTKDGPAKQTANKSRASGPLARGDKSNSRDANGHQEQQTKSDWLFLPAKRSKAKDEPLQLDANLAPKQASSESNKGTSKAKPTNIHAEQNVDDDDLSDDERTDVAPLATTSSLLQRAFAPDDADIKAFSADKTALIAAEAEKEDDTPDTLPGWGSWTGVGLPGKLRRNTRKSKTNKPHNPLVKSKTKSTSTAAPITRQDDALPNVLISEKAHRKGTKAYLAPILPHTFETKTQYERALRVPVGPEWTTKEVFQRSTRPRVVVGRGQVIEAMGRPMV